MPSAFGVPDEFDKMRQAQNRRNAPLGMAKIPIKSIGKTIFA